MALVPIKTASTTGYCDCIHGCYELASLRDEEDGKGYCPFCAKEHLELNKGLGLPLPASSHSPMAKPPASSPRLPEPADPAQKFPREHPTCQPACPARPAFA
jgi:hypothetical protein